MNLKKGIIHEMDCSIYAANDQRGKFCDCGLIHDLRILDFALAGIIYDKYEDDLHMHETGEAAKEYTKKELREHKKSMKLLEEVFGPISTNLEDVKEQYNDMKKVIKAVFPSKRECPGCYARLEEWFHTKKKEAK
jgi:5-bromo-4-chloroindolyl phosphate hydrolysis protein